MPQFEEVDDDEEVGKETVEAPVDKYGMGDFVEICGLASAAGSLLNGQTGKVVKAKDATSDRYGIRLPGKENKGIQKSIKEDNLKEGVEEVGCEYETASEDEDLDSGMAGMGLGGKGGGYGGGGDEGEADDMDFANMMGGEGGKGGGKGKAEMMASLMAMMGKGGGKDGGKGGGKDDMMAQMMGMMGGKGGGEDGGKGAGCPTQ